MRTRTRVCALFPSSCRLSIPLAKRLTGMCACFCWPALGILMRIIPRMCTLYICCVFARLFSVAIVCVRICKQKMECILCTLLAHTWFSSLTNGTHTHTRTPMTPMRRCHRHACVQKRADGGRTAVGRSASCAMTIQMPSRSRRCDASPVASLSPHAPTTSAISMFVVYFFRARARAHL